MHSFKTIITLAALGLTYPLWAYGSVVFNAPTAPKARRKKPLKLASQIPRFDVQTLNL
ncbi:hypothetical protein HHE02_06180 [Helicobacter heilmannii]|nr:hypothetical protein HHE02_06180 [Helicobacter heilmannii]